MSNFGGPLTDASLWLILLGLVITGIGLPFPETMFIVAVGIVAGRRGLPAAFPILSCSAAVLLGDLLLYWLARTLGPPAFRHRPLIWLLPPKTRPKIDALFERHGSMAIFVARHVSGVRAATFALAGMHRMPIGQFVLWDTLAISVSVPIFAALGFFFSSRLDDLELQIKNAQYLIVGVVAVVVVVYLVRLRRRTRQAAEATSARE